MTDDEIIKALECCFMEQQCNYCPLYKEHSADCLDTVLKNAHALITSQQAENENLKVENQSLRSAANSLKMHYEEAQAEIKGLNAKNMLTMSERNAFRTSFYEVSKQLKTAKSEAVKECLAKVKNYIKTHCNPYGKPDFDYDTSIKILNFIDNLVKEMVGENNGG